MAIFLLSIVIFILKNKPSGLYKMDLKGESLKKIIDLEAIKIIQWGDKKGQF